MVLVEKPAAGIFDTGNLLTGTGLVEAESALVEVATGSVEDSNWVDSVHEHFEMKFELSGQLKDAAQWVWVGAS